MTSLLYRPVRLENIELSLEEAADEYKRLTQLAARVLRVGESDVRYLGIARRALDARGRAPRYVYSVDVAVAPKVAALACQKKIARPCEPYHSTRWQLKQPPAWRPVVIGAGPAGLFAALTLAEAGWAPIVIERGFAVEQRARDVSKLYAQGVLNPESNVCYGEGGAGTFSDGKLYTRVGDERVCRVLEHLIARGSDPNILIDNRPHLGTDKLVVLLQSIRAHLQSLGTQFYFGQAFECLQLNDAQQVVGVRLRGGETIATQHVVMATGHSAHDVWESLHASGAQLEARPFAVGFRIEHDQMFINTARYGEKHADVGLPAADYRLAYNEGSNDSARGVYSFCMCPGGVVVTTPTRPEELCINGMSHASRQGRFANSAMVVTVGLNDFAAMGYTDLFAGVHFQRDIERKAYEAGGGNFKAPAARVSDFLMNKTSSTLKPTSYRRGLTEYSIHTLYPDVVTKALQRALTQFNQKMRGFVSDEAQLIGVETRTASPIRVLRNKQGEALNVAGLYPAGEGMGYGGGIVSAAVDGMRAAEHMLETLGARNESI